MPNFDCRLKTGQAQSVGHRQSENLLYGRPAAELEDHRPYGFGQGTVERTSAGALVAAATEAFRDPGYVKLSLAAQTHAVAAIGQFAEEGGDLDAADRKDIVHQSFAVLFESVRAFHLLARDPEVADMVVEIEIAQGFAEQSELASECAK